MEPRLPSVVTDHGIGEERVLSRDSRKFLAELGMELGSHLQPTSCQVLRQKWAGGWGVGGDKKGKGPPRYLHLTMAY